MTRPRLLDLFCGAGGAAMGYHRAGFDVVGVDIKPQPRYPFEFVQADALAMSQDVLQGCWHENYHRSSLRGMLAKCLGHFAAIHASPPCQKFSSITRINKSGDRARVHPDLIEPVRDLLNRSGLPYVIENVEGAPLAEPVLICGSMFEPHEPVFGLRRHRLFETNWPLQPPTWPCRHQLQGRTFKGADQRARRKGTLVSVVPVYGGTRHAGDNALRRQVMDIDWMSGKEITQAIPPAYTELIGRQLMATLCDPPTAENSQEPSA